MKVVRWVLAGLALGAGAAFVAELVRPRVRLRKQIQRYKQVIRNHFNLLLAEKRFKGVVMIADVDAQ